ncbi:MAG: hypothetical protein LH654_03055 [Thermoleophilia bacterium]|nr:hypothetical protein [Thermoleophilia bacterium]
MEAAAARASKAQARERAATLAAANAVATITPTTTGSDNSFPRVGELLLGLSALLVLLALAPSRAAYAVSPRVGQTLAQGRLALAGAGVSIVVGLLVAFGLGGGA